MREHVRCPKCQHNRILAIASVPDTGEFSTEIRAFSIATAVVGSTFFGNDKLKTVGEVSAAVCRRCGYTELYTTAPDQIPIDGKYVRELVGPDPEPYR